jgi:hypothetical protein
MHLGKVHLESVLKELDKNDRAVLDALVRNSGFMMPLKTIAKETDIRLWQTKRAARRLARQGLAEVQPGFDECTGLLMGRGYTFTDVGEQVWKLMR